MNCLLKLAYLADELDRRNMKNEADQVDKIIRVAVDLPRISDWLRKQYNKLRILFSKKPNKEYGTAAADRLDDMLRRKQSGPPDDRIFLWFCQRFPNSCENCNKRHGRMRTLRQWRVEGLPGSNCTKNNCACLLVPLLPSGTLSPNIVQTTDDADIAANTIGLREDNSTLNLQQGFVLEPFFSDYGSLD